MTIDSAARVLVVDDDPTKGSVVVRYFKESGLRAAHASWQQLATGQSKVEWFNMMILAFRVGQMGGCDLLRTIQSQTDSPAIIVADPQRDAMERVIGLELGADDYLTEPFALRELLARVRAILRRRGVRLPACEGRPDQCRYQFGGWELDQRTRRLTNRNGEWVTLTKSEYALLIAFLDAPGRVLTRQYLLQATRVHADISDRSIDVQTLRLRRKVETEPNPQRVIKTERGIGYIFALPVQKIESNASRTRRGDPLR
jgi:two-component system OmpR family response regulator